MTYIVYFLFRYIFFGGGGLQKNNKNKHPCNKPLPFDTINDVFISSPGFFWCHFICPTTGYHVTFEINRSTEKPKRGKCSRTDAASLFCFGQKTLKTPRGR